MNPKTYTAAKVQRAFLYYLYWLRKSMSAESLVMRSGTSSDSMSTFTAHAEYADNCRNRARLCHCYLSDTNES